jgi:hypothetical protein
MCRARLRAVQAPATGPLKPGPSRALQVSLMGLSARLALEEAPGRAPLAAALLFYNVPRNVQKQH